jgi:ComF family protein
MLTAAIAGCRLVFDIVIPVRCVLCGRHGAHVCQNCSDRLESAPLMARDAYADYPAVVALGAYTGSLRSAVLSLKFRHRRAAAFRLGELLGAKLHRAIDVIVPVPLHPERLLSRGFNQAEMIAQGIASTFGTPLHCNALVRTRATIPQSSLALRERGQNVCGAFALGSEAPSLQNARVMIVDDVVTTGATAAACAAALREGDVTSIMLAALAIRL